METITSKDGTTLAFDRLGSGPPVVLVCGGSVDRMADAAIAQELASDFTVFNYDRRGRGDSGDTLPYAIEREIEDIEAMLEAAGGSANLWGSSSGAALAMIAHSERRAGHEAGAVGAAVHPRPRWRGRRRTRCSSTRR